ncbi:MAG: hypothetical protein AAFO94_11590 [Bacteroidota bacterium]
MQKLVSLFIALLFIGIGSSYAQSGRVNKIRNAPLHAGEGRVYTCSYKTAIKYAREAISEAGLSIEASEKVDDINYMIIGRAKASVMSWGEHVRVVVTDDSEDGKERVTIKVYTLKNIKINVTARASYTQTIHSNIEAKLEFE